MRSAPAAIRGSKSAAHFDPPGIRGDGPTTAARYWGLGQQDYYQKADVWPLNPQGEIFAILQIEDTRGVENLDDMLKNVPGIGCILIGEGDLSQELGYPRQYEHKVVLEWMKRIVDTCKKHNVVVGHPHVEAHNVERVVKEGYRFLMCAPVQSYGHLDKTRQVVGRDRVIAQRRDAARMPGSSPGIMRMTRERLFSIPRPSRSADPTTLPAASRNQARKMYHAGLAVRPGIGNEIGSDAEHADHRETAGNNEQRNIRRT